MAADAATGALNKPNAATEAQQAISERLTNDFFGDDIVKRVCGL